MLWYIFNGLYLVLWSALLVHCLQRREYYPIIGRRWGTKIFWLLTFIFFNPLLSVIYFVFAVLFRPRKIGENSKTLSLGSIAAIACTILVIVLFEVPFGNGQPQPAVVLSRLGPEQPADIKAAFLKFEPYLGVVKANNKVQTYSSASTGMDAKVSLRNIMLICESPNQLLDRVAREFQKSLIQLPYVERVWYYSYQTPPEQGQLLPDVFIVLNMPVMNEKNLFRGRMLEAKIEWQAGTSMFRGMAHSLESGSWPAVQFSIESDLDHLSQMIGVESPRAAYKLEAKNISGELMKSIRKQFENLLDKYGEMPRLPEMLYGTYQAAPAFSFITNDNIRHQISGCGLFKDNDTIWQFADSRPTEEVLAAYCEELKSLGWTEDERDGGFLKMRKGNDYVFISRRQWRGMEGVVSDDLKKPAFEAPMIMCYESCWSDERMQEVLDKLLHSDVGMQTLLVLHNYFQTPKQREHLLALIEQSPIPWLDGFLVLARCRAENGEMEKGRESLMQARAMQYAEKSGDIRMEEIEDLAEKLGDGSLAESAVGEDVFRKTGFLDADQIDELMIVERELNEPVLLYRSLGDGELQTVTLRVVRSRESSASAPYSLLMVEKCRGSSSSSEKGGDTGPNGGWLAESYLYSLSDEGKAIRLKIESLCGERFRFIVISEQI